MISVTIPTLNSARTIGKAIASVQDQEIDDSFEVIVIDSGSNDSTAQIAQSYGAKVFRERGKLLAARRQGVDRATGEVIVMLDSDQVLRKGSIAAARDLLATGHDMVVLGERVFRPRTFTEWLSDLDKQLLSCDVSAQLDPQTGVMLPRVFRRDLLVTAFSRIPKALDEITVAHDHAIIYFECFQINSKVGYVPDAVWHLESERILTLWRKNFRYGWSTRQLFETGHYADLIGRKTRTRTIRQPTDLRLRLGSLLFLTLKAVPYAVGYAIGRRFDFQSSSSPRRD